MAAGTTNAGRLTWEEMHRRTTEQPEEFTTLVNSFLDRIEAR
jgi:hypothetical protein